MSTLREAAQQALELRRLADKFSEGWHDGIKIDATDIMLLVEVAAALEQPEQEPVAWNSVGATSLEFETECLDGTRFLNIAEMPSHAVRWRIVAPPRREWVNLTEEEIQTIVNKVATGTYQTSDTFARAIEAALRSKNYG